jgi:hypothetical protein
MWTVVLLFLVLLFLIIPKDTQDEIDNKEDQMDDEKDLIDEFLLLLDEEDEEDY